MRVPISAKLNAKLDAARKAGYLTWADVMQIHALEAAGNENAATARDATSLLEFDAKRKTDAAAKGAAATAYEKRAKHADWGPLYVAMRAKHPKKTDTKIFEQMAEERQRLGLKGSASTIRRYIQQQK